MIYTKTWPQTVILDNPIAHPFPMKFVEELPLEFRGYGYTNSFEKDLEIFRFTAHEWISDALLFRGLEIKPRNPGDPFTEKFINGKLTIYIDHDKVLDGWSLRDFMKEGGGAIPVDGGNSKYIPNTFRGWIERDEFPGFPDSLNHDHFVGYFFTNKSAVVAKVDDFDGCMSVEIKLDIARYRTNPAVNSEPIP